MKFSYSKPVLALFLFLTINGCTTTKITSNKLETNLPFIESIYYAVYAEESIGKAAPYLDSKSSSLYSRNKVSFEMKTYTFLENDGEFTVENVIKEAQLNNFQYALMMAEDDYDYSSSVSPGYWSNGMYMGGSNSKTIKHGLKATLFSVSDTTEVWRAVIEVTSGDYGNREQTGASIAKKIISQFVKDGLLSSTFNITN